MGVYNYPNRLVPTYILPAIEIRLLGKFISDIFKNYCVETDGQTDIAKMRKYLNISVISL